MIDRLDSKSKIETHYLQEFQIAGIAIVNKIVTILVYHLKRIPFQRDFYDSLLNTIKDFLFSVELRQVSMIFAINTN